MPLLDRPSGPTPWAAGGSQSPSKADKPRAGSWTGWASALEPAGERGELHPDRSPGPKIRGRSRAEAEFGSRPATGKDRGRRPGLAHVQTRTVVTGHTARRTDIARTRTAIRCHSTDTVGPRPAAAPRLGQELVAISPSGRFPATARTASAGVAVSVGRGGAHGPRTILKAKMESLSRHSATTNGSHHLRRDPDCTLTVNVTTAQKN